MKYKVAFGKLTDLGLDRDDAYIILQTAFMFGTAVTNDNVKVTFKRRTTPGGRTIDSFDFDDPRELVPR